MQAEKLKLDGLLPDKETRERIAWIVTVLTFVLTLIKDWEAIIRGFHRLLTEPNWAALWLTARLWFGTFLLSVWILFVLSVIVLPALLVVLMVVIMALPLPGDDDTKLKWSPVICGILCGVFEVFFLFPWLYQPDNRGFSAGTGYLLSIGLVLIVFIGWILES